MNENIIQPLPPTLTDPPYDRRALEACGLVALDARGRVIGCEPRPDGRLPARCCT